MMINNGYNKMEPYMTVYSGFSTVNKLQPPYTLTDLELVKQDLMNEFHTKLGERVMMPEFGSSVWDILMDPLDTITEQAIIEDAKRIIGNDPRVEYIRSQVFETEHAFRLEVEIMYTPGDNAELLYVEFSKQNTDTI